MPRKNRVLWTEGLLLEPHHFQQHDRWLEGTVDARATAIQPYGWGYGRLEVDPDLLTLGKFGLREARGIFPDGTPFSMPHDDPLPAPIAIDPNTRGCVVMLVLPLRADGAVDVLRSDSAPGLYRHAVTNMEVRDSVLDSGHDATLEVGTVNARLMLSTETLEQYACVPTARIVEMRTDNQVLLDDRFIPTVTTIGAAPRLNAYVTELRGLLQQRAEMLAGRAASSGQGGAGEIADFLMLQIVNRHSPVLAHLADTALMHPEAFYRLLLSVAGELATLTLDARRPPQFGLYRHEALQEAFDSVIDTITAELRVVRESPAVPIPLKETRHGIRIAQIQELSLLSTASFVLTAAGSVAPDVLRRQIAQQAKIGSVARIAELVNNNLPGVELQPLPVAPRQIPFYVDHVYMELDRGGSRWAEVIKDGGLAMHLAGNIPGLQLALWAIRGQRS